jgi:hypothetical protein
VAFAVTLRSAGAAPSVGNDERKTQWEAASLLCLAADIFRHDLSWISPAACAIARNNAWAGTIVLVKRPKRRIPFWRARGAEEEGDGSSAT